MNGAQARTPREGEGWRSRAAAHARADARVCYIREASEMLREGDERRKRRERKRERERERERMSGPKGPSVEYVYIYTYALAHLSTKWLL